MRLPATAHATAMRNGVGCSACIGSAQAINGRMRPWTLRCPRGPARAGICPGTVTMRHAAIGEAGQETSQGQLRFSSLSLHPVDRRRNGMRYRNRYRFEAL